MEDEEGAKFDSSNSAASLYTYCELASLSRFPHNATTTSIGSSLFSLVTVSIVLPLAVAFNILIFVVIYRNHQLRSRYSVFIVLISMNDFLGAVVVGPIIIAKEVLYQKGDGPKCSLNLAFFTMRSFVNLSGVLLVSLVNIERFVAVKFPFFYKSYFVKSKLRIAGGSCWVLGAILTGLRFYNDEGRKIPMVTLGGNTALSLILTLLTWRNLYVKIKVKQDTAQEKPNTIMVKAEKKLVKISSILAIGFLFTRVIPFAMMSTLSLRDEGGVFNAPVIEPLTHMVCFANFLLDPIIFGFMNKEISNKWLGAIKCLRRQSYDLKN